MRTHDDSHTPLKLVSVFLLIQQTILLNLIHGINTVLFLFQVQGVSFCVTFILSLNYNDDLLCECAHFLHRICSPCLWISVRFAVLYFTASSITTCTHGGFTQYSLANANSLLSWHTWQPNGSRGSTESYKLVPYVLQYLIIVSVV